MLNPFDPGFFNSAELSRMGFAHVGTNVQIAKNCVIIGLPNIWIGDNVRIDAFTGIFATTGKLTLAGRNHIGGHSHLAVAADMHFGMHSGTSQGVRVYTSTDDYSGRWLAGPIVPAGYRKARTLPIFAGDHVIIGSNSVILPGAHLPDGCAVGAQSMVMKRLKPWTLYFGAPAEPVKERSRRCADMAHDLIAAEVDQMAA